jgi:SAM-dependent methyltransferase
MMLLRAVRDWFGQEEEAVAPPLQTERFAVKAVDVRLPERVEPLRWSVGRLQVNEALWGKGFVSPGGMSEMLQLAKPTGISAAGSLLLVGVGSGGPAGAVVRNLGAWVTGRECEPVLLDAARTWVSEERFSRKVALTSWDPAAPSFNDRRYHHCVALEPLRRGLPEPILDALAQAVRPGGHLVICGSACDSPLDEDDPTVARWTALEGRIPRLVPTAQAVTRMLGRLGYDVRVVEDITRRHVEQALLGWRLMMARMREQPAAAALAPDVVREAELWSLRRRLLQEGRLRMMRWHAISPLAARAG